jgi:hypothetical protein
MSSVTTFSTLLTYIYSHKQTFYLSPYDGSVLSLADELEQVINTILSALILHLIFALYIVTECVYALHYIQFPSLKLQVL